MKLLTIIIPFLNEGVDIQNTINSIYNTANRNFFKIIAVDDESKEPSYITQQPEIIIIRNPERKGVDASRQIGIDMADTPYIFIIDAHMVFKNGWMEKLLACLKREPDTAWCTRCLGLGYGTMDINNYHGIYNGATILFVDKNANNNRPVREILEPKWISTCHALEFEVPCVLGANYGFSKNWLEYIQGFRGLKMWGTSEPFISLKTWMAGGKCKCRTDIEIGHKFRDNAPYSTEISSMAYNKILLCKTILPDELGQKLIKYMPHNRMFRKAMQLIERNKDIIKKEKEYYNSIFKISIYDFCKKFNIDLPS